MFYFLNPLNMVLEQYNSKSLEEKLEGEKKIQELIKESIKEEADLEIDVLKDLDELQLVSYIEGIFKKDGAWDNYNTMKKNPYFGFIVQASLDLLSDALGDKEYDINGKAKPDNYSGNNYKSLDAWLGEGGVDNNMGQKARTAVTIAQRILGIHPDGAAGPQFFAKVCSVLKGENEVNINDFKVKDYDNGYTYSFDDGNKGNSSLDLKLVAQNTFEYNNKQIIVPRGYKLVLNNGNAEIYDFRGHYQNLSITQDFKISHGAKFDAAKTSDVRIKKDNNNSSYELIFFPPIDISNYQLPEGYTFNSSGKAGAVWLYQGNTNYLQQMLVRDDQGKLKVEYGTNLGNQSLFINLDDSGNFEYYVPYTLKNGGKIFYNPNKFTIKANTNGSKTDIITSRTTDEYVGYISDNKFEKGNSGAGGVTIVNKNNINILNG